MVLAELRERLGIAGVDRAEQILGLVLELVEVGTNGQAANGHDEPPRRCPWSAGVGRRRFVRTWRVGRDRQVDSVLSADGRRPARHGHSLHPKAMIR